MKLLGLWDKLVNNVIKQVSTGEKIIICTSCDKVQLRAVR